jgi:hypothetical protein
MSEKGVRSAQKMKVGPCIPVGAQLQKAGVGPTSGPTRRLSHHGNCGLRPLRWRLTFLGPPNRGRRQHGRRPRGAPLRRGHARPWAAGPLSRRPVCLIRDSQHNTAGRKRSVETTSPRPGVHVHLGSRAPATAAARAAEIALGPNVVSRNQGCEWARALTSLPRRPLYSIYNFLYKIHRAV